MRLLILLLLLLLLLVMLQLLLLQLWLPLRLLLLLLNLLPPLLGSVNWRGWLAASLRRVTQILTFLPQRVRMGITVGRCAPPRPSLPRQSARPPRLLSQLIQAVWPF